MFFIKYINAINTKATHLNDEILKLNETLESLKIHIQNSSIEDDKKSFQTEYDEAITSKDLLTDQLNEIKTVQAFVAQANPVLIQIFLKKYIAQAEENARKSLDPGLTKEQIDNSFKQLRKDNGISSE